MSTLSTHVLDTSIGQPATGIRVTLLRGEQVLGDATTDAEGRAQLTARGARDSLEAGDYRLRFDVEPYFRKSGREGFYKSITIDFVVRTAGEHYHVPLLLSPFGYSTYRGS
jgi:5-hydroxyisourate hydrolase